jgi:hypothetical protein
VTDAGDLRRGLRRVAGGVDDEDVGLLLAGDGGIDVGEGLDRQRRGDGVALAQALPARGCLLFGVKVGKRRRPSVTGAGGRERARQRALADAALLADERDDDGHGAFPLFSVCRPAAGSRQDSG